MSYVLNFLVEILLILTYDLASTDQAMNDSSFHMVWVGGLEMRIKTCTSRFLVHFVAKSGPHFITTMMESVQQLNNWLNVKLSRSFRWHLFCLKKSQFWSKSQIFSNQIKINWSWVISFILQPYWSLDYRLNGSHNILENVKYKIRNAPVTTVTTTKQSS
jgi:hypothetical protein